MSNICALWVSLSTKAAVSIASGKNSDQRENFFEQTIKKARETGLGYSLLDTRQDIDDWNDMIDYYHRNKRVSKTDIYAYTEFLVNRYDSKRRGAGNRPKSKTSD